MSVSGYFLHEYKRPKLEKVTSNAAIDLSLLFVQFACEEDTKERRIQARL